MCADQVKGDAFLARVMDNGDDFQRLDLNVAEVSSSAPWVRQAYAQNERKRAAEAPESTLRRMQEQANARALSPPPPPPPVACSPSEQAKIKGNAAFQLGKYGEVCTYDLFACFVAGSYVLLNFDFVFARGLCTVLIVTASKLHMH